MDKRSAQSADYEIGQRLFDMMAKELAAKRTYFVFDFAKLGEGMEELETPAEAHLNELSLPEGVSYHVSYTQALKEIESQLPDQKFPFVASETAGDGKRPGERWVNGSGMVFSWCPPGKFKMGLEGSKDAEPVDVEITKGFWISTYELTQRDYRVIRGGRDADKGALRHHPRAPITHIGNGSPGYAKALTEREQKAGRIGKDWEYRIPTEAQWEYACRAGTSTRYSFGDSPSDLYKYANFADRSLYQEDPGFHYALRDKDDGIARNLALVGSYQPNAWGIHDMHGNVSEWCREIYFDSLPGGADPFPQKETKSSKKVVRGGAWCSLSEYCQSGFRSSYDTGNNTEKPEWLGVRFVLVRK